MVSVGLGENCYDRTVMSHTEHGGQASDQDSNSGPGRHRQHGGQIAQSAPTRTAGQVIMWVTPSHRHQDWPISLNRPSHTHSDYELSRVLTYLT